MSRRLTLVAVLVTLVAARLAKSSGGKNWVLDNSEFFRQKEIATKSDVEVEQDLDKRNTHCDQGTYTAATNQICGSNGNWGETRLVVWRAV